jgi:hypothetical protein
VPKRAPFLLALAALLAGCTPSPRVYTGSVPAGPWSVAVIPLANYTESVEAADRTAAIVAVELAMRRRVRAIDPGVVEDALSREPWLLTDRIPPDVVQKLGQELGADALLVGSVLQYGYRQAEGEQVPQISIMLRLLETTSGEVLWTAAHSRDGTDGEWLFGFGRVTSLEQLSIHAVREVFDRFPTPGVGSGSVARGGDEK